MIGRARVIEQRELRCSICLLDTPVKIIAVDNNTTNGVTMATNPLCATRSNNICTKFNRTASVTSHAESIVHNQRKLVLLADCSNCIEVRYDVAWIPNSFSVHSLGILID